MPATKSSMVDRHRISVKHGLTAYDATYLVLAESSMLPLATLDKHLITTAKATKIALL